MMFDLFQPVAQILPIAVPTTYLRPTPILSITTTTQASYAYQFGPMYCESSIYTQSKTEIYLSQPLSQFNYAQMQPVYIVSAPNQSFPINQQPFSTSSKSIEMEDLSNLKNSTQDLSAFSTDAESEKENKDVQTNIKAAEKADSKLNKRSIKIRKFKTYIPKVPKKAEMVLKRWFMENYHDPYPMQHEKIMLAKECGITVSQVNNWFQNVRKRKEEIPCKFSQEIERALMSQN
jgi:hypothetical protein